ncbi:MAG: class I SAM-dependent methyltransferase [Desulfobulbus sp.]
MTQQRNEMAFLESIVDTYVTSKSPQDRTIKTLAVRTFKPHIHPCGNALEFGCSDGFMTSLIAPLFDTLTVIDGSRTFIEMAQQRLLANVEFVHTLFEEYRPYKRFDYIFATYVLEHVQDAVGFLQLAGNLLSKQGLLFLVVPNARALSRQLARHIGLLDSLYALTPNDINHGHRRVYDRSALNRDIETAGLYQVSQGGLLLKPLADFQMDKLFETGIISEQHIEGLYKMGLEYPDLAGSLFSICRQAV